MALAATVVIAIVLQIGGAMSGSAAFWAGGLAAAGQALVCGLALWGLILARQQKELRELPTVQGSSPVAGDLGGFKMSLGDDAPMTATNIAPKASDEVKTLDTGFQRMVVGLSAALILGLACLIGYMIYRNIRYIPAGQNIGIPAIDPLGVVIGLGSLGIYLAALTVSRVTRQTQGTGEAVSSSLVVGLPGVIAVAAATILCYLKVGYASEIAAGIVAFFMIVQGLELATNATKSYAGIEEFDQEPVDLQALPLVPMLNSVWVSGLKMLAAQSFGLSQQEERLVQPGVFARMMPRALVALAVLAVFVSCFRTVEPGEVAIRERLGQATDEDIEHPLQSGIHFMAPWPIDTLVRIPVDAVQKVYVGVNENEVTGLDFSFWAFKHTESGEPDFITGDQQLVGGFVVVWWRVKNPTKFYRNLSHSEHIEASLGGPRVLPIYEAIIEETANQAVAQTFGTHTMEQIIGAGRQEVQEHTKATLQAKLDALGSGIDVIDLSIRDVHPPKGDDDMATASTVVRGPASAYEEVVAAREDSERFMNNAAAYKTAKINQAKGEAAVILDSAQAYKQSTINNATGERDRRAALIEQFSKQKEVGRNWMTYQALEQVLPSVNKVILGPKVESPTIWQPGKDNNLPVRPMPSN